ncbi:MAG: hypothetical protein ABIK43_07405, partial [candidate division WOR-3 bacterium]
MLLLLFAGSLELQRTEQRGRFVPEPYADAGIIRFASGETVLVSGAFAPAELESAAYFLVCLRCPVDQQILQCLRKGGLEPVGYLAWQKIICRRTGGTGLPLIDTGQVVPFSARFKLAPEFSEQSGCRGRRERVVCALWPGEDANLVARQISTAGGLVLATLPYSVIADADPFAVAHIDGVAWVQRWGEAEPFNVNVQWVMQTGWWPIVPDPVQGRRIWQYGLRGQNMVVGLFDSGINTWHRMFSDPMLPIVAPGIYSEHRKIVAYKLFRDAVFGDAGS